MKIITKVFLVILFAISLSACSSDSIPEGMNKETYEYGCKALDLMDKYHSGDLSDDEIIDRLEDIENHLNSLEDLKDYDDYDSDYYGMTESSHNLNVVIEIDSFQQAISDGDTYSAEDNLRKSLGQQ